MSEPETLNRYRDLERRGFGSRQTIWRRVKAGEFPVPIDIGTNGNPIPVWPESVIQEYLESRPPAIVSGAAA